MLQMKPWNKSYASSVILCLYQPMYIRTCVLYYSKKKSIGAAQFRGDMQVLQQPFWFWVEWPCILCQSSPPRHKKPVLLNSGN